MKDRLSVLSQYLAEIKKIPFLSREREADLAREARTGASEARDELIKANLAFVVKICREYTNLGIPFEDLLNEGNIGLIEAARRFNGDRGTKFITYAAWWIRKSILRALCEQSRMVRVPSYQLRKVRAIREAERGLTHQLGREPLREEISRRLSVSHLEVDQTLQHEPREFSLDEAPDRERNTSLAERLEDAHIPSAEERFIRDERTALLDWAMDQLTEQQRSVLNRRFGLAGESRQTLKEVGKWMGVSRERVRQIEEQAKAHLRKILLRRHRQAGRRAEWDPAFRHPEEALVAVGS